MGFAGKMKRKFSLQSLQVRTAMPSEDVRGDYDTDSPPYSPTPSEMERPSYHPQTIFDLRQACASLVNMTNPPDPDDEPDHQETLRRYEAERKAKYIAYAKAAEAKSQKAEVREVTRIPKREEDGTTDSQPEGSRNNGESSKSQAIKFSSTRPRQDIREAASRAMQPAHYQPSTSYQHVPKYAAKGFSSTVSQLPPSGSQSDECSPPAVTANQPWIESNDPWLAPSSKAKGKQKAIDSPEPAALEEIRRSIHTRPKTSAAACVDYKGTSDISSKSSSRSTSNYNDVYRPTSTALTSVALTPGEDRMRSHHRRPSDESYQEELARKEAEAWMRDQLLQRQAEQYQREAEQYERSGRAARPGSRASKLSRMTSRSDMHSDRPPSRAGSIAVSIAGSISNYIRPRQSSDSLRSGRSSVMSDRSRSSSVSRSGSTGFWSNRRNSLRRKGSWASFRSAKPDQDDKSTKKNGEPNLNRPLPALPGLDQYKESKTHIGQLMKGGARKKVNKKNISDPRPVISPDTVYTATLPKPATPILDRTLETDTPEDRGYQYSTQHYHMDPVRSEQQARRSTMPKYLESQQLQRERYQKYLPQSLQQSPHMQRQTRPVPQQSSSFSHFNHGANPHAETLTKTISAMSQPTVRSPVPGLKADRNKGHNAPVIRGPSYHQEVEAGVYPRPMDVGKYPNGEGYEVRLVDDGPGGRYGTRDTDDFTALPFDARGGRGGGDGMHGAPWERKRGLKERVERMFGGRGHGRAVAAN